jgi:hypothetical protein
MKANSCAQECSHTTPRLQYVLQVEVKAEIRPCDRPNIYAAFTRLRHDLAQLILEALNLIRLEIALEVRSTQQNPHPGCDPPVIHTNRTSDLPRQPIGDYYPPLNPNPRKPEAFVAELFQEALSDDRVGK